MPLTVAHNMLPSPILGGGGYMGGSVLQDKKTGHWYIQIRWDNKTEKFFRYDYKGIWFHFESRPIGKKVLSIMQDEIDNGNFSPAAWRPNSPLEIKKYVEVWLPPAVHIPRHLYFAMTQQLAHQFNRIPLVQ